MKNPHVISSVLLIASILVCSLWLHGSKEHLILSAFCSLVFVTLVLLIWRAKDENQNVRIYSAALLCGIGLSYFSGTLYYQYQIRTTQRRLYPVLSALEKSRQVSGAYPKQIDELLKQSRLPWLTKGRIVFQSRDDLFWIYFRDPNSGLMDVFIYDSESKKWDYRLR